MKKEFFLIRHGESLGNIGMTGAYDPPLSPGGRAQAACCAEFLRLNAGPDMQILTSPFLRCRQTAEAISLETGAGIFLEPALHEYYTENLFPEKRKFQSLREIASGTKNIRGEYGETRWLPEDYETKDDVKIRAGILRNRLLGREGSGPIACVGHLASIAALAGSMCRGLVLLDIGNCSVTKIVFDGTTFGSEYVSRTDFMRDR